MFQFFGLRLLVAMRIVDDNSDGPVGQDFDRNSALGLSRLGGAANIGEVKSGAGLTHANIRASPLLRTLAGLTRRFLGRGIFSRRQFLRFLEGAPDLGELGGRLIPFLLRHGVGLGDGRRRVLI